MKANKKFIICAMLVLMLFLCVNASSASEPLNQTLEADIGDEIAIGDASGDALSVSGNDGLTKFDDATLTDEPNDVIYVSVSGNNESNGQTRETAVKTIAKAVELANEGHGKILILEGTYTESNIEIDVNKPISIAGEGNVVIDGGASSNSIFVMHGGEANFTNIKFTKANPSYGGAIFMNYGAGTSREVIDVNVIVDNCTFDDLKTTKRGGAIYALYAQGNIIIKKSNFYNTDVGQWGGAVCAGYSSEGLNVEISNCRFENNSANNGGGAYLQAKTIRIVDSTFNNNSASADSGAIYLYDCTASVDNCIITNNKGGSKGVAIKFTRPTNGNPPVKTLTIENSVIENNSATTGTLPAIYVDMQTLDISYSSLVNDLSIETRTGEGYDAVYGQGIAIANNNWWNTNDPTTKVTGINITIDKWVIMNVEASADEVEAGDTVYLYVDFIHVNTTSGVIEDLTGGEIPKKSHNVRFTAVNGTIEPDYITVPKDEIGEATFTAGNVNALINVESGEASVDIVFKRESTGPTYDGIIYVDKSGDDNYDGSESNPVATVSKAIELADKGSGQIVINEGTYTGNMYHVTKALNITGKGNVVLDADNGRLFTMSYGDSADWLILTNLTIAGADDGYGQAVYSFADELILTNLTITNNPGSGSLIKNYGKLTMDGCTIANHNGGSIIDSSGNGDIIINNTVFENNVINDNAIVYASSTSGNAVIENTTFTRNTGQLGIVKVSKKTTVKDSRFINNTNRNAYGGAINDFDELTVTNSVFINNRANKNSGAINVATNRKATITKSVFINNTAGTGYKGDAIANSGKLTINYCVLITNGENSLIYSESEDDVNARYNWWGTNDDPKSLNCVGTYEDDWGDDADCTIDSSRWVVMNVNTDLTGDIDVGDNVEVTVDFTNYMDLTNTFKPLSDSIPEVVVTSGAVNGEMNCTADMTKNNIVKFLYTAVKPGEDTITISSSKASVEIPLTVAGTVESIVYVDAVNGLDTNDGKTRETAVQTIEKAVEIADGKIIVLAGEYTVNTLLNITKDLEIIGEGNVTVKSNSVYTVTTEVWDDWEDEWVTDTKTHYNLIENNANLNITNIKFTLVPASISEYLILNNANLLINTSEFANIKITSSKGVIQNIKEATLNVNGTVFKSASSTYGAINSNGDLLVNNSRFLDADMSSSAGSYSTAITAYNKATIINSEFKNNKGSAGGAVYVMYSYTNLANPVVDIINCTFKDNQATGSSGGGAAIRCSGNQVSLTVTNSTFTNNIASRYGGAVYAQGTVNIDQCVFIGNGATEARAVYAYGGTTTIENSIILEDGNAVSRYESTYSDPAAVTANNNWWGSNDAPTCVGDGITVDSWVKMDASYVPYSAHAGDGVTVTATFDNTKLPSGVIKVTFTSTSGNLKEAVTVNNAQAATTYTIDINDVDITATSGSASVVMPIEPPAPAGTIYVSYEDGSDANDGLSADNAVKTIAHAIELADAGNGRIILLEGTHILADTLTITKDVDIKGLGTVIIDGNKKRFIQNGAGLNLTNIEFTNGYSTDSSLIATTSSGKYMNLNNVKFYKNGGKNGVAAPANTQLTINNSQFYDNNLFEANSLSQGVVNSNTAAITVENTVFKNNTANKGAGLYILKGSADILNCTFDSNVAQKGTGAAIQLFGAGLVANIVNSTFANNLADRSASSAGGYGSAIYVGVGASTTTITQSVFINNTGNGENLNDAGIYVSAGNLNISDSIILTNDGETRYAINKAGGTVTAENNWWGTNDKANTNAEVSKIVKMTATLTPEDAQAGDEATITVSFDNENLPRDIINVTFTSSSGLLNEAITMNSSQASLNYTINERDLSISVKSSQAEILFTFNPEEGTIFVLPGADDTNPGTRDAPVGTIAHALEIASKGKIVLLEGTHRTGDLGVISDDVNITGEGRAVIDAQNSNRILYVGEDAKVVISNVIMVNGYTIDESGALLGNSNELTLINCTLANATAAGENNGGAIFSVGKLTIINTTIANCTATRGGAIYTQTENENTAIIIVNSTFENNIAKGKETWGGGAIYAQRTGGLSDFAMTIDNSTFKNNKALGTSCGGAIQIEQLNSNVKITDSEFIENHANGKADRGGGAIYTSSPSSYERQGAMTITGSLFENNTCDVTGGAICAKTTTVNVASSVLINNTDSSGLAVYGLRSDTESPSVTLNDNWWGANDSPKDLVGGNDRYKPTLNRWAILTITNDTPIAAGSTVKLTVSINSYTTGTANGTMSKPITVKRSQTVKTSSGDIAGMLVNGEFTCDYTVPENLKYIAVTVDGETQILYAVSSPVTVEIDDVTAAKYDKVTFEINVTSTDIVDAGAIELYVNGEKLIATIGVKDGKAIGDVVISEDEGRYNLTAKYVNGLPLLEDAQKNATLTVTGVYGLYNETFFSFFDDEGILRDEITEDELIFHCEFSNLGVNVITIPRSISIKGDGAKLYDMAIYVQSDDVNVTDMALIAKSTDFTENDGAAIKLTGENIELKNVSVDYTAPDNVAAYAILAKYANGFKLSDSTVIFDANNRAGIIQQAGLIIDGSSDVEITGNKINATMPARDVAFNYYYPDLSGIYQDLVLGIGMQNCLNVNFTDNEVNVNAKSAESEFATIDSFMIDGTNNLLIKANNFTQTDFTGVGKAGYANVLDLYNFEGVTVEANNILVNTTTGERGKGTAYPIQANGPYSGLVINNNNLTSISKGPALGIYSQNYDGTTDIVVTNNKINVTGYATADEYALVSGMELQDTSAKVYNNIIYSKSISSYDDVNALYGISYAQYTSGDHTYDIKGNTIVTEGKYAVYLLKAKDTNVTGNTLYAHELVSDEAVNILAGQNNLVRDNLPSNATGLIINVLNITVGEDAVINITFEGFNGNATVIVDGEAYDVRIVDGFGNLTVSALAAGDYKITAKCRSDIGEFENRTVFNVARLNPEVSVKVDGNVKVGDDLNIAVSVPNATGKVNIIVNGRQKTVDLDENGSAAYTIENITSGDYHVTVNYLGDKNNEFASAAANFTVNKLDAQVNLTVGNAKVGQETTIRVNVTDGATGRVVIDVAGKEYSIDLAKTNNITVAFDIAGQYPVIATYLGDDNYNETKSASEMIAVTEKSAANVRVEIPDDIKVGDEITITITADTDADLTVLINGEVQDFIPANNPLGASSMDALKAVSGKVVYTVNHEGIYNVTVTVKESDEYASQTVTEIFEATKNDAVLEIAPITDAKIGDTVTVTVLNETDGTLTVRINGEEVTGEYEIKKAGAYTIVVESAATDSYNAGFASYTFEVAEEPVEQETNITVVVDGKEYGAVLVNGTANVTTDKVEPDNNITVIVDGKEYVAELVNGTASVTTDPVEVDSNITVIVDGVSYAAELVNGTAVVVTDPVEVDSNIIVVVDGKEYEAVLVNGTASVTTDPVEQDNNVTVVVDGVEYPSEIVDGRVVIDTNATEPDKNITVIVDGKEYAAEIVNGTVNVTTDKEETDNNITVVVDGVEYPSEIVDGKVIIDTNKTVPEKTAAEITVPENVKPGELASVDISIPGATGNASVIVDGVETVVELINGTAGVAIENVTAGSHSVVVVYQGDETHAPTYSASGFNATEEPIVMPVASEFSDITIGDDLTVSVVLKDETGNVIANAPINYAVNGIAGFTTTDSAGKFTVEAESGAVIVMSYAGSEAILGVNTTLTLNNQSVPTVVKAATNFNISGGVITIKGYAVDTKAGEEGIYYATELLDADGNPVKGVKIQFAVNDKIYSRTTNENGSFNPYKLNMIRAGRYTMAFYFAGDDNYTGAFASVCVDLDKKPIKIKASSKTFRANKKVKYTIILSTIVGSSHDGKAHIRSGKIAKLTLNGKTYTGKTDKKGKVTFNIKNVKKGKFNAVIDVKQDGTYDEATKNVKLTFN